MNIQTHLLLRFSIFAVFNFNFNLANAQQVLVVKISNILVALHKSKSFDRFQLSANHAGEVNEEGTSHNFSKIIFEKRRGNGKRKAHGNAPKGLYSQILRQYQNICLPF